MDRMDGMDVVDCRGRPGLSGIHWKQQPGGGPGLRHWRRAPRSAHIYCPAPCWFSRALNEPIP